MADDVAGLLDEVDRELVAWKPEAGDKVAGVVTQIATASSEYGVYPLLTLDPGTGPLVQVHCFHTVLMSEVERAKLAEGDTVAIKYSGRSGDKDMANYRVAVRRGAGGRTYDPAAAPVQAGPVTEEPF